MTTSKIAPTEKLSSWDRTITLTLQCPTQVLAQASKDLNSASDRVVHTQEVSLQLVAHTDIGDYHAFTRLCRLCSSILLHSMLLELPAPLR